MPDDWSWFWAGENARTNLLRDELEGLQRTASASSAQSARLSSQLRTLQGSIESRLQALSTAFDAYVELGDVREQLDAYPDTSAIRRDTVRTLAVLAAGGTPGPVDGRGVDYWLVDAVNEVVALVAEQTPAPGERATVGAGGEEVAVGPGRQEHETFVVAALGWLGHGERVAARVAPLLVGDGALAAPQVVLWRAAVHGVYGDVLDRVHHAWASDLDLAPATWDRFTRETADAPDPVATLRWTSALLSGGWAPSRTPETPAPDDRTALRGLLDALVGAGLGEERVLLERARLLRARIEDPGSREADPQAEPPRTTTTDLVQQALRDPDLPTTTRQVLVGWVRPGLVAAGRQVAAAVAATEPAPTVVRTELGDLEVGPDGVEPSRLAAIDALAEQRWASPRNRLLVPVVVAAVGLLVGLVLLATDLGALGVLLLVVALVAATVAVREVLRARTNRAELAATRERTRTRVEQGRERAAAVLSASRETKAEVAALARVLTEPAEPLGSAPR